MRQAIRSRHKKSAATAIRLAQAAAIHAGKVRVVKADKGKPLVISQEERNQAQPAQRRRTAAKPARRKAQSAQLSARCGPHRLCRLPLIDYPKPMRAMIHAWLPALQAEAARRAAFSLTRKRFGMSVLFRDDRPCDVALHYLGKITWHPSIEAARRKAEARNRGRYKIVYLDGLGGERIIEGYSRRNILKAHVSGLRGIREDFGSSHMSLRLESRRAEFAALAIGAEVTMIGTRSISLSIRGGQTDTGRRHNAPIMRLINPGVAPSDRVYEFSGYAEPERTATRADFAGKAANLQSRAQQTNERHFETRDIEARGILQADEKRKVRSLPVVRNHRATRAARAGREAAASFYQIHSAARLSRRMRAEHCRKAAAHVAELLNDYRIKRATEAEAARDRATVRIICGPQSRLLLTA